MTPDQRVEYYFLCRLLWWRNDLDRLDAEAVAQLIKALKAARGDVGKALADDADIVAAMSGWNQQRADAVNRWLDDALAPVVASTGSMIIDAAVTAAVASLATYNDMLGFGGLAKNVMPVNMTAEQLVSWFRDTPLGGGTLDSWVNKAFSEGVRNSIVTAIQAQALQGKGTAATVRHVLHTALEEGFNITRREAVTLVRTYVQAANNGAMEAVYEKNSGIIKGFKRVETLDNRTCRICALADGTIYARDEERPRLPAHPRCRGVWLPLLKSWRELGIPIRELDEAARPWTIREPGNIGTGGRKILNYGTTKEDFGGWWRSLSSEDQLKTSVGPVRGKLLKEGEIAWADLSDRKTGLPRTLAELGFDEQGNPLK